MSLIKIYYLELNGVPYYIGKTKGKLSYRFFSHEHKVENSTINLLDEIPDNGWRFWESWYIELFKSWGFVLTNKNNGGGGPDNTNEETRQKIINHPTRGNQISKSLLGKSKHKDFGKNISKITKGKPKPLRTREHSNKLGKIVIQLDLKGNFIKEWPTVNYARTQTKISNIKNCLVGICKTAGGYNWEYKS